MRSKSNKDQVVSMIKSMNLGENADQLKAMAD